MSNSAPSPFLVGTKLQIVWDSTSLGWLKTCPKLYEYQMIDGWRPRGSSVHLRFGIEYHAALESYDKLRAMGESHESALCQVVTDTMRRTWERPEDSPAGPWTPDHSAKTRENLIRSIIWYLEEFQNDPAKTIVLGNGKPAVELSFKMELDFGPSGVALAEAGAPGAKYILSGHLDRVVDYLGSIFVTDRKTAGSTLTSNYFHRYEPDNQMSLYTLAGQVVFNAPVKGVIIDAVQVAVGFSRFGRGITYRTEAQLEEWLADTKHWLRQAERYAAEGYWPHNDKACQMYGGCAFREICSKDPSVRETFLASNFVRDPWNPLVTR